MTIYSMHIEDHDGLAVLWLKDEVDGEMRIRLFDAEGIARLADNAPVNGAYLVTSPPPDMLF